AEAGIGVGEVGGAAEHGNGEISILGLFFNVRPVVGILEFFEAGVELGAVDFYIGADVEPLSQGHLASEGELVHVRFGEGGEFWLLVWHDRMNVRHSRTYKHGRHGRGTQRNPSPRPSPLSTGAS